MRVLHICTEKTWRGGENQIRLFIEGSYRYGVVNFVAIPRQSRGYLRFAEIVETLGLPSSSRLNPISIYQLVHFCKKNQIELIDAQGSGGLSLALFVKIFLPNIKIVNHRRVDDRIGQNLLSRRKYLSPLIDHTVAISNAIKSVLVSCGVDASSITVVPSAVDFSVYKNLDKKWQKQDWSKRLGFSEANCVIGCASALVRAKGQKELIEAFSVLAKKMNNIVLLLAGEGPARGQLEQLVQDLSVTDRVYFLGHIQNVPEFLSALDVLCMPSHNEGLGTILLDAIGAGATVIGSSVGGIPEIIQHEKTGLLFKEKDSNDLYEKLQAVIESKSLREKLSAAAFEHVSNSFSLENMILGNIRIYKKVLNL